MKRFMKRYWFKHQECSGPGLEVEGDRVLEFNENNSQEHILTVRHGCILLRFCLDKLHWGTDIGCESLIHICQPLWSVSITFPKKFICKMMVIVYEAYVFIVFWNWWEKNFRGERRTVKVASPNSSDLSCDATSANCLVRTPRGIFTTFSVGIKTRGPSSRVQNSSSTDRYYCCVGSVYDSLRVNCFINIIEK